MLFAQRVESIAERRKRDSGGSCIGSLIDIGIISGKKSDLAQKRYMIFQKSML
jgi:hypothetical protein